MALTEYKRKRTFGNTPEPVGGKAAAESLRFVVQKHKASRLHYDFRLEMKGVLKSWAVPKGPSLNPADKRLAMEVEDHPYDYKDFEGIIPKGNYGAGTVIVWDEGTYEPIDPLQDKAANERALLKQLKEGSLKVVLHGKKLKGEFALVRTKGMGENAWLLIKHKDRYAQENDVTLKDKSVKSGQTLEKVAKSSDSAVYGQRNKRKKEEKATPGGAKPAAANPVSKTAVKKQLEKQVDPGQRDTPVPEADPEALLRKAEKAAFPAKLSPMLATLVDQPFDDEGWEYEVKWDGYRALAFMDKKQVALRSRNDKSFDDKFYPVFDAVKAWGIRAVVDGEIVVVGPEGISSFSKLQNWRSEADGDLLFYVFDLLWYEGKNLMNLPLKARKAILATLIPEQGIIRSGYSVAARGSDFFEAAGKLGLEGIIAKRSDSPYRPGERTRDWLKIKVQKRQEVVIGGYTRNEGSPKPFSSLLLGVYEQDGLHYAGKVGTGFTDSQQKELLKRFKPLVSKDSPFTEPPDYNKPSRFRPDPPHAEATWLRPELVCEIHFAEVTEEGVFRHPAFVALREDKDARQVVRERELPADQVVAQAESGRENASAIVRAPAKGGRKTLLNPYEKTQVRKMGGIALTLTNLNKVYWPEEGYTKRDMLNYYYQMAPYILPYLKNRPQSLNRFPNGINGKSFYQKNVTGKVPDWVEKHPYRAEGDRQKKHYMLCNNEAALLYMANLGAIEMNPWSSTVKRPDQPDWCILDLDPDKGNTFEQVIEVARTIHAILEDAGIPAYCKTSGSTGLHIYIPLGAKYSYDQSQLFAKWVAAKADAELDFTSIERMTDKRKGKIYIDYLQNRPGATLAAPYSLRPKPGATVSMPLHWEEVKPGLRMKDFTIQNAVARVKTEGDLFKPVLKKGVNLKAVLSGIT